MESRLRPLMAVTFVLIYATLAFAVEKDVAGSKDHPLVSRMPGYFISSFQDKQFDQIVFTTGAPPKTAQVPVEGHTYRYIYKPGQSLANSKPSALQVVRNVQDALKKMGAQVVYEAAWNGGYVRGSTLKLTKNNKTVWIFVKGWADGGYNLDIVEQEAMKQDVVATATDWFNDLQQSGKATVGGIYFDTAKSTLKPESDAAIAEVAKLLKDNPTLKVYVVGHTDTVGAPSANLKLSQERAQAVTAALVSKHGINASRLLPFGAGPYAPVTSNRDEEGRAKNRRVELVQAGE